MFFCLFFFFFFKQKTAYEIMPSLVGSEMCIRDRARVAGLALNHRVRRGPLGLDGHQLDVPSLMKGLTAAEQTVLPGFAEGVEVAPKKVEPSEQQAEAKEEVAAPAFGGIALPDSRDQQATAPGRRGNTQGADTRG